MFLQRDTSMVLNFLQTYLTGYYYSMFSSCLRNCKPMLHKKTFPVSSSKIVIKCVFRALFTINIFSTSDRIPGNFKLTVNKMSFVPLLSSLDFLKIF